MRRRLAGLNPAEQAQAGAVRDQIARAAQELPPDDRLHNASISPARLAIGITDLQAQSIASPEQARTAKERFLRQLESRLRQLADTTKPWKLFKEQGRGALEPALRSQFDQLFTLCAANGLLINPYGELESMLTNHGILYTTDKRARLTPREWDSA